MPLTLFRKKTFEICCCAVASAEYTNEMLLLIFWKCICSRIWKLLCCSLMAFLFWSLTLFGDSEWMQREIQTKNIDNFFYICSFFVALLSTVFFPFLWFWGTIQSRPSYRCITFWSPNPFDSFEQFDLILVLISFALFLPLIQIKASFICQIMQVYLTILNLTIS